MRHDGSHHIGVVQMPLSLAHYEGLVLDMDHRLAQLGIVDHDFLTSLHIRTSRRSQGQSIEANASFPLISVASLLNWIEPCIPAKTTSSRCVFFDNLLFFGSTVSRPIPFAFPMRPDTSPPGDDSGSAQAHRPSVMDSKFHDLVLFLSEQPYSSISITNRSATGT